MDVKSASLNNNLEKKVYVEQPAGFVVKGEKKKVCKLKKDICGLKQASRTWNSRIDGYLSQKGFTRCPYQHALYVKKSLQGRVMFVCLYVDDILFTWTSKKQSIVALSTCEAEYIAATSCVCHVIWLRKLMKDLQQKHNKATQIFVDNKSTIALAKNPVHYERLKHIDTQFHFLRKHKKKRRCRVSSCQNS